tara:strand:- start:5988 stop:6695 length:708 start_codon:yes stop_codon:yes gene_type:complete
MAGAGNNVYQTATQGMQDAAGAYRNAMAYQPMQFNQANLSPFMNPYTQNVIDNTMATMSDARQNAINAGQLAATNASAYGGSRHGISDALTNERYMKAAGDMSANLNNQAFGQAVNQFNTMNNSNLAAMQQNMAGAGNLANLGLSAYGLGQAADEKAYQRGLIEQGMNQKLIDAANQQFMNYLNQPSTNLGFFSQLISGMPQATTQTVSKQPGLFDLLASPFVSGKNSFFTLLPS